MVAGNLFLLSAAMPAVGHSDNTMRRSGREAAKPRSKHQPAKNVRARHTGTEERQTDTSDDDDDDDVAGQIAGACCAGFIGAMVEGAANDPSDVEGDYREPARSTPTHAGVRASEDGTQTLGSFDARAAKQALTQASREVSEQCGAEQEQLTDRKVTATFDPSGNAVSAAIDPPLDDEPLAECARKAFLQAQVPPFTGEQTVVTMSLKGSAPPAD